MTGRRTRDAGIAVEARIQLASTLIIRDPTVDSLRVPYNASIRGRLIDLSCVKF